MQRRRWVLTPLAPVASTIDAAVVTMRATTPDDDPVLADLLRQGYDPSSTDYDPDEDYAHELRTWRTIDHADDAVSRIAFVNGRPAGCALIAREWDAPFLYEVAVPPEHRRRGLARTRRRRDGGASSGSGTACP